MRRRDAPKRAENTRVPDRKGVVRIASGEAGEDMALPVFGIANLGISHRKKVEEQSPPIALRKPDNHNVFHFGLSRRLFPSFAQVRSESGPSPLSKLQVS